MIFWTVRRPFGDNSAKFIGIGMVIETLSFSMPVLQKGGKRIPFWGFGMMIGFGVKVRKVSLLLLFLTLRKFIPPLPPPGSMKS